MTTFDNVLPIVEEVFSSHADTIQQLDWVLVNRDLTGRVRFVVPSAIADRPELKLAVQNVADAVMDQLGPHGYATSSSLLYESDRDSVCFGAAQFPLHNVPNGIVVDRLATDSTWQSIHDMANDPPRIVFYSIKGGVGRSTALAITAWHLAQAGLKVLVLDLDLESPGLSSELLPEDRQPQYGITDWLVEDLVGNGSTVLEAMVSASPLSHDGEIYVAPAHGRDPGEYLSKLGRVWMSVDDPAGGRQLWDGRLRRLVEQLEDTVKPDVVLIDSRSGIDEISSGCVTALGARLVLMFAIEGHQTWNGYNMLFSNWQRTDAANKIRDRLQVVAALVPEIETADYLAGLRERSYELFAQGLYDDVPPGSVTADYWHFEEHDETAPHAPWAVRWHRSFSAIRSLEGRLADIDAQQVMAVFGPLLDGVAVTIGMDDAKP